MFQSIGPTEIIIIVLALIILFGSSRISDLAKSLGETEKELKKVKKDYKDAVDGVKTEENNEQHPSEDQS
jgi:sec-independent protein translocase protein TatA